MSLFLTQIMNGIGNGAVYASLALALVLIFRTTGILNFAQGEMALYSTYLVWFFTARNFPVWLAIVIAMAISFVGGALIEHELIVRDGASPPSRDTIDTESGAAISERRQ